MLEAPSGQLAHSEQPSVSNLVHKLPRTAAAQNWEAKIDVCEGMLWRGLQAGKEKAADSPLIDSAISSLVNIGFLHIA